ncbi:MAG: TetR/AcrR family transcriptional regulator [Xanthobacteraceae bacterium]|nr:MAG: TetR/AcrR family transcriptional regulator [Xanthobacteraceae bacterium]
MARTRSPDYDAIQASILDTTAGLFASRGFAASSIGDIAEACGCSKSRLYHYFESKESILSTLLTTHIDRLLSGAKALILQYADPADRFRTLIRYFLEVYAVSSAKHVVMLTCIEFLPAAKKKEVLAKQRELVSIVRNLLAEIHPQSHSDYDQSLVDTMLFFGMINWTYTWYKANGSVRPSELADRSVQIFLDGYRHLGADKARSVKN